MSDFMSGCTTDNAGDDRICWALNTWKPHPGRSVDVKALFNAFKSSEVRLSSESLVNDTKLTLKKIYNFFQVEFNEQFLEKSININSKQNTLKMLYKNKKVSNRISNYQFEKDFEVSLIKMIKESLKYELIKYDEFIRWKKF